nr:MAG TPA: hypothetical protein [Caudoviricetes sp.]
MYIIIPLCILLIQNISIKQKYLRYRVSYPVRSI